MNRSKRCPDLMRRYSIHRRRYRRAVTLCASLWSAGLLSAQCSPSIQSLTIFNPVEYTGQTTPSFTAPSYITFDQPGGSTGNWLNEMQIQPISITSAAGCGSWRATPSSSWITLTSGATGTGNGTTNYTVAANTGTPRSGTITYTWSNTSQTATYTIYQSSGLSTPLPGPYRVSYRYNAGGLSGSQPNPFPPSHDPVGIGPYFLTVTPGSYSLQVVNTPNGSGASVWVGTASSGTRYNISPGSPLNVSVTSGQQIVLYTWDWYDADNDPNGWADITVTPAVATPTLVSITPNTGITGATVPITLTGTGFTSASRPSTPHPVQ